MKKQFTTIKSITGPILSMGALLTCSALLIGCAGNNTKPSASVSQEMQQETTALTAQQLPASEQAKLESAPAEQVTPGETAEIATVTYPDVEIETTPQPEQQLFQFGFDKAELGDEDKEILKQHAKYLIENPEVIVKVVGHTDHHGPKAYNEYLSKKRAEAVTAILLAEGVMESQIEIKAMANDEPLETAQHARDNRRVELEFEQLNMVSN